MMSFEVIKTITLHLKYDKRYCYKPDVFWFNKNDMRVNNGICETEKILKIDC